MRTLDNVALLPAYLASFVATAAAIVSLTMSLDPCVYVPCVLGFLLVAYGSAVAPVVLEERFGQALRSAALTATLILIPLISLRVSPAAIVPDEALDTADLRTAVLMGWLLVGLVFVVRPPQSLGPRHLPLSFLCVPSLSVFGLIATINPNPEIVVAFILFLLAAVFLVGYEQLLERGLIATTTRRAFTRTLHGHTLVSGEVFGLIFVVACAGTAVLSRSSSGIGVGSAVARIQATGERYFYQRYDSWASLLNTFRVGGGPSPDSNTVVMRVRTGRPGLLRGRVYTQYTGSGWNDAGADLRTPSHVERRVAGVFRLRPDVLPHHTLVSHTVETAITMPSVLFAGGLPYHLRNWRARNGHHPRSVTVDPFGCLLPASMQYTGARYTVISMVPEASPEALRAADGPLDNIPEAFLAVPNGAVAVHELAPEITAGAGTPYAKVEAITQWLAANCTYDAAGARVPRSLDVADYFLSRSQTGACDQFATAAALLCRAAGVPSRVVVGYLLQDADEETGDFLVRERDAHAWIEVYVPEYEWIPVDPTAGSTEAAGGLPLLQRFLQSPAVSAAFRWGRRNAFWTVFSVLSAYLLYLVVGGLREDRRSNGLPERVLTPGQRSIVLGYLGLCRSLARLGLRRAASQTPEEFLETVRDHDTPSVPADFVRGLQQLTAEFSRVRYGEHEPGAVAVARAAELRRSLPRLLRRRSR